MYPKYTEDPALGTSLILRKGIAVRNDNMLKCIPYKNLNHAKLGQVQSL